MAKAGLWTVTDAEERKRGERTGLDTLVVHERRAASHEKCLWVNSQSEFRWRRGDAFAKVLKMLLLKKESDFVRI